MTTVSMVKKWVAPVFLFVLLVAQAALAEPPTEEDFATAYEYTARAVNEYDPELSTQGKMKQVENFFDLTEGVDYDKNNPAHHEKIHKYAATGSEVLMVLGFDYKAAAKQIAQGLGISGDALAGVDRYIDAWDYKIYVNTQPTSGGSDVAVISVNLFVQNELPAVKFALYHEFGHALWAIDAIRNAAVTLVPGGDTSDRHKMEYFADIVAAKMLKAEQMSQGEVLHAATALFGIEGEGTEHPSGANREKNIQDEWENL